MELHFSPIFYEPFNLILRIGRKAYQDGVLVGIIRSLFSFGMVD
jgi:hypothetical protein